MSYEGGYAVYSNAQECFLQILGDGKALTVDMESIDGVHLLDSAKEAKELAQRILAHFPQFAPLQIEELSRKTTIEIDTIQMQVVEVIK